MGNEICLGSFESGFLIFFFEVDSDLQKLLCSWFFEKKKKIELPCMTSEAKSGAVLL